jgi:hypothetical protein
LVIAVGGGLVTALHARSAPPSQVLAVSSAPPAVRTEPSTAHDTSSPIEGALGAPTVQPAPNPPRAGQPPQPAFARTSVDSLPEEVRLLSRAEKQLNSGLAEDALKTLTEHEHRFPNGALAEERLAARIHALCTLGRTAEARAEMAKLGHAYPQSPHLERASRFCSMDAVSPGR